MDFGTPRQRRPAINAAPLVDVVFLLLVFFLLTSSFIRFRMLDLTLAAPPQSEGKEVDSTAAIFIRIGVSGVVTVGEEIVIVEQLAQFISDKLQSLPDTAAIILTERGARLQLLVTVLEQVRAGGVHDVRIAMKE
jgi:biopolymer transport protein ExbD